MTFYKCSCCGKTVDEEYYRMFQEHYGCPECKNKISTHYIQGEQEMSKCICGKEHPHGETIKQGREREKREKAVVDMSNDLADIQFGASMTKKQFAQALIEMGWRKQ